MADYNQLRHLSLSRTAIACYQNLYEFGATSARELADRLQKPRTSIYHSLNKLEVTGFVERHKSRIYPEVTHFSAVRLDKAMENLAVYQRRAVGEIVEQQVERSIRQSGRQFGVFFG
jgi:sugar-specific transcriptional regulator TrmB